ncbi:sperm flagellar protein 1, partial [Vidua chalybeata]|uniref:sperm flagellar protein 1 n=1 Tax=Vidua chalybeata TaxID=81927 RepID=UPI0023A7D947
PWQQSRFLEVPPLLPWQRGRSAQATLPLLWQRGRSAQAPPPLPWQRGRSAQAPPPLPWQRGRRGRALMAAERPEPGPDESLVSLYRWLDTVPLSRPRKNIARDFSDGVLAAEVVKFFFPSLVELHSFVPTSSTAQKVANWGHLNRKVLSKLNLRLPDEMIQALDLPVPPHVPLCVPLCPSVSLCHLPPGVPSIPNFRKVLSKLNLRLPDEMIQALVRSRPGTAEQLLQLLRAKILQRQRNGKGGVGKPPAEPAALDEGGYLDTGQPTLRRDLGRGFSPEGAARAVTVAVPSQPGGGPGDMRQQLADRERALQLARDTIQILQAKVARLEQLLLLKNLRIDDLSRRLQQPQGPPRR